MDNSSFYIGHSKGIDILGFFPLFHDAEVISFSAERAMPFRDYGNKATLKVHVFYYKTIGTGTVNYEQLLDKSILISIMFHDACDIEVSDFNMQNVIDGISITKELRDSLDGLLVDVEPIHGFGCKLFCSSIEIEAANELRINEA